MQFSFVYTTGFVAAWESGSLTDEDLQALESLLLARPKAGAVMSGTGGLRKVRFAPPSRHTGARGAYRVCYALYTDYGMVYLVTMFPKNEKANLAAGEKKAVRALLHRITEALKNESERND